MENDAHMRLAATTRGLLIGVFRDGSSDRHGDDRMVGVKDKTNRCGTRVK